MAAIEPIQKYTALQFGGVWNESQTPGKLGGNGLTSCSNLTYRRFGAWGKRSGSKAAYAASAPGPIANVPTSGIRWYRALPTPLTQLVIGAQGALWTGNDPNITTPSPLTQVATFSAVASSPLSFASAYDPSANGWAGGEILIVCGTTSTNGFATGGITIASGSPTAGDVVGVSVTWNSITLAVSYTVLSTDTLESVGQALVSLINQSALVSPTSPTIITGPPPLNSAYLTQQAGGYTINLGSLVSGANGNGVTGNNIQYKGVNVTGTSITISPTTYTHMTGGGSSISAPIRYDGTNVGGLSYQIRQAFTGCVAWHDHVWYWGDPNNPDTLYASDINQPVGFTFMNQEGGYQIGRGDGDPAIQTCIPIGNALYVFKRQNIYIITGYDFQSGEYQFQVQPYVQGEGIPSSDCVTVLNNNLVYWNGSRFSRLAVGSFAPEYVGRTIQLTSGKVALGNQGLMRAVAGSFVVATHLNNAYPTPGPPSSNELFTNVALFACDLGDGAADNVLAYDDDAANFLGNYAWAPWTGWNVAAWIPFGNGLNNAGTTEEPPELFWIPPPGASAMVVNQFGADAGADSGASISWKAQTGWIDLNTPALLKELHRLFLDVEATPGATFNCTIVLAGPVNGTAATVYPPRSITFPITVGTTNEETNQTLIAAVSPFARGYKFMLALSEQGSETSYEVAGGLMDTWEEPFSS